MNSKISILLIIYLLSLFYNSLNACSTNELQILNDFYSATGPWNGPPESWVDEQLDCCQKDYISCNNDGNVTGIDIYDQYMFSSISVTIDLSGLLSLTLLNLNEQPITLLDLELPSGIEILSLLNIDLSVFTGDIFLPSLSELYISSYPTSPVVLGEVSMPILHTLTVLAIGEVEIEPSGLPMIDSLTLSNVNDYTLIMDDICNLNTLTYLDISAVEPTTFGDFPVCLTTLPLQYLYFTYLEFQGDFPTLSDSVIEFHIFSTCYFSTVPEFLPINMTVFDCTYCFSTDGTFTIPEGWETSDKLTELYIDGNYFSGEIPLFLVERLTNFSGSYNYFEGNLDFLAKIKPMSDWDLSGNLFHGELPDLQYQVYLGNINIVNNYIYGFLDRFLYCKGNFQYLTANPLVVEENRIKKMNPSHPVLKKLLGDIPDEYSNNDKLTLVTNLYNQEGFNNVLDYMENYCSTFYNDPSTIEFINPSPYEGGKINISNSNTIYYGNEGPVLLKKSSLKNLGDVPDYDSWEYDYFVEFYGKVYIRSNFGILTELSCKLVSLKGVIECEVPVYDETFQNFIFSTAISNYNDVITLGAYTAVYAPNIDDVQYNYDLDYIEINGDYFGNSGDYINSFVDLLSSSGSNSSNIPTFPCPIKHRSRNNIQCKKPKTNKKDGLNFNVKVTIGGQATISPQEISFSQEESSPSNCFNPTGNGEECQGRGVCTDNQICQCNQGYKGIFCEIDQDTVQTTPGTNDNTDPTGNFENESADSKFQVKIVEVREINFRSKIVKKFNPTWKLQSKLSETEFIFSAMLQSSKIQVNLNLIAVDQDIEFANTTLQTDAGSLKYTVEINEYPFQSQTNSLEVVFQISAIATQKIIDLCQESNLPSTTLSDPNTNDIKWIQMNRGNSQIIAKIINRCELDSRVVFIQYRREQVNENQVNLIGSIPYFKNSAIIDPNYSVLLQTAEETTPAPTESNCSSPPTTSSSKKDDKNWKIATGVTVAAVVAVAAAIGGYVLYKKKLSDSKFLKQFKNLTK